MITTANYIIKVCPDNGETYIFEYDAPDVWLALEEFWHEDWNESLSDLPMNTEWPMDVYAMDNGRVIKTYKFKFCIATFHGFFDHGRCALNEFAEHIKREGVEPANDVTSFMFYMWNAWCEDECREVFKENFYPHFWNKWCECCERYGTRGASERFYAELSDANRNKLVKRALEVYEGNHDKRH